MSDYMKEAERLADAYANTFFCEKSVTEILGARAALLAHIQRGVVPEGERAAFESWIENEAGAGAARRWLNTEAYENGRVQDYRTGWIACLEWLAAAPAPDHFRDGAKMVSDDPDPLHLSRILHELAGSASLCWEPRPSGVFDSQLAIQFVEQALSEIRSRMMPAPVEVPMPEPVGWYVSGSDPEHAALWRECPDDEQMQVMNQQCDDGPVVARPLVLGADAKRYGDAREAAGYARGRAEAGRDAERYRWLTQNAYIGECCTDGGVVFEVHNTDRQVPIDGDVDAAIDAALRGEVKP